MLSSLSKGAKFLSVKKSLLSPLEYSALHLFEFEQTTASLAGPKLASIGYYSIEYHVPTPHGSRVSGVALGI